METIRELIQSQNQLKQEVEKIIRLLKRGKLREIKRDRLIKRKWEIERKLLPALIEQIESFASEAGTAHSVSAEKDLLPT